MSAGRDHDGRGEPAVVGGALAPMDLVHCRDCKYWEWSYVALVNRCGKADGVAVFLVTPASWGCADGVLRAGVVVPVPEPVPVRTAGIPELPD